MSIHVQQLAASRGSFFLNVPKWEVRSGEFCAVLGTNGAGKSSFLAALTQEIPYCGNVCLHGRNLRTWPLRSRARHVAVLPQQSHTSFAFTAGEVVALGLTPLSVSWRKAQTSVRGALERVGCLELIERPYPNLSGGERQRVNLARVLLQLSEADLPPLLFLDEPTSAQDLGQQHTVMRLAKELARAQGYIVVAILHDLNHALRYCDTCLLLQQGRALAVGAPEEILTPDRVETHWGYRPHCIDFAGHRVMA